MNNRDRAKFLSEKIGIQWDNYELIDLALTHSSYSYEKKERLYNNQRLEFLGDAVLELIVSDYLYNTFPSCTEGELTKLRASIVCEPSLARVARNLGLGECLYMGKGEERSGGRERPSILADAFESLLGAVYLDSGLEEARSFALEQLRKIILDVLEGRVDRDYKTELQEILQKKSNNPVSYIIMKEEGPPHNRVFTAGVLYMGKQMGTGTGHSKKEAEQHAARHALERMDFLTQGY
ncbi:MAG: ribonuclease III [Bacillota bacterium]